MQCHSGVQILSRITVFTKIIYLIYELKRLTRVHGEAAVWFWNFLPVNGAQSTAAGQDPLHSVPAARIGTRLPGEVKGSIDAEQLRHRQLGIYRKEDHIDNAWSLTLVWISCLVVYYSYQWIKSVNGGI